MKASPTRPEHVSSYFSQKDVFVIHGGVSKVGIESTILRCERDALTVVRKGMITPEDLDSIAKNWGIKIGVSQTSDPASPGQKQQHYQPKVPLVVFEEKADMNVAIRLLEKKMGKVFQSGHWIDLPALATEAANQLYHLLHNIPPGADFMVITLNSDIHEHQSWEAIIDRLKRAATIYKSADL